MSPIAMAALQFLAGLVILAGGAELFIRGAVRVARRFGISPFIIGLTLVGFGTSAPELVVNISAALKNSADLATGNVVGSNIANVGLILGITALICPLATQMRVLKVEVPIMIAVSLIFWGMAMSPEIVWWHGLILLSGFVGMMVFLFRSSKQEPPEVKEEIGRSMPTPPARLGVSIVLLILGLAGLVFGADMMVNAAVFVAEEWGVSKMVVGLTVVAVGTSLPELASSVAAALRGQADIAVGNVVGSNLFNILLILGTTSLVAPLPVPDSLRYFDLPVMIGFAILVAAVLINGLVVKRWEGAILLALYAAFIAWQVYQAM